MSIDLSIIIVNWNSADYVRACIGSIMAEEIGRSFEIIVVDNASFDGCRAMLTRDFPDVVFVQNTDNLGFGAANNVGFTHARGQVLLFLNPDTEVRNCAVRRLFDHVQANPECGIMGARLLNTDGTLQTSCVQAFPTVINQVLDAELLRRSFPRSRLWGTEALFNCIEGPAPVQAVSGACMMMRRELFERLSGFSRAFFMYGEDLDLCARAARCGYQNYYASDCEVLHHGGGPSRHVASSLSVVMMRHSVAVLLRRSQGPVASGLYRLGLTCAAVLRLMLLAVVAPVLAARRDMRHWRGAVLKWRAILLWGIGFDRRPRRLPAVR